MQSGSFALPFSSSPTFLGAFPAGIDVGADVVLAQPFDEAMLVNSLLSSAARQGIQDHHDLVARKQAGSSMARFFEEVFTNRRPKP